MSQDLPSPELLRKLLRYEPDTGKLFWKVRTPDLFMDKPNSAEWLCSAWNKKYANKETFLKKTRTGYRASAISKRQFLAHRVAWAIFYNEWPSQNIDHINNNPEDNRIENLRQATQQENCWNKRVRSDSGCGYKGVGWNKKTKTWFARIQVGAHRKYLGSFESAEEAHKAYCQAAKEIYGQFYHAGG